MIRSRRRLLNDVGTDITDLAMGNISLGRLDRQPRPFLIAVFTATGNGGDNLATVQRYTDYRRRTLQHIAADPNGRVS